MSQLLQLEGINTFGKLTEEVYYLEKNPKADRIFFSFLFVLHDISTVAKVFTETAVGQSWLAKHRPCSVCFPIGDAMGLKWKLEICFKAHLEICWGRSIEVGRDGPWTFIFVTPSVIGKLKTENLSFMSRWRCHLISASFSFSFSHFSESPFTCLRLMWYHYLIEDRPTFYWVFP